MNPTFGKRFCRPDIRAREVVVLPTCCFVAATKIGRGRLVDVDENRRRYNAVEAVVLVALDRMGVFEIMMHRFLLRDISSSASVSSQCSLLERAVISSNTSQNAAEALAMNSELPDIGRAKSEMSSETEKNEGWQRKEVIKGVK